MEIEYSKTRSSQNKRKYAAFLQVIGDETKVPLKKSKLNNSQKPDHLLNLAEKSFIYLHKNILKTKPKVIAKTLQRDSRTVVGFIKAVEETDTFHGNHASKGRYRKGGSSLGSRHKDFLRQWLESGEINSVRGAWKKLNSIRNLKKVSYHPVKNYIKTLGGFVKPGFKSEISEKNKNNRLKYCEKFKNYSFKKVLWTDESIFQLNTNNTKVFHFKGQKPPKIAKLNPNSKIMVWAGVSYYGKTSLHIIEKNVDTDEYLKILKKTRREILSMFEGRGPWRFQQDGAPAHRPLRIRRYIRRWLTPRIHPHPAQSPDLNPIEMVWAQMKVLVEKERLQNKSQLKIALMKSWEKITKDKIIKCIENMPEKIKKIIELDGEIA